MSTLKVEVVKIDEVKEHTNADALEIAIVKGWQTVIRKGEFNKDDLVVYFPLDSILPVKLSDEIGVTKYLSKGRVKAAKLRGEPSYGLIWPVRKAEDYIWPLPFDERRYGEGMDLTEGLGVTKWEPPLNLNVQNAERPDPLFDRYTDIENLRNYPNIIQPGELVVMTEKIHGCVNSKTKILMANGEEKYIKNISGGDFVTSFNEKTKEFEINKVLKVIVQKKVLIRWLSLSFENGRNIICTEDHKILTKNRGYVCAKDLNEQDELENNF